MDLNSHGTHVSGTIAAVGNNATGITGINWTVKIMPVRFLSSEGYGYLSDAILAINYAVDNGAKILSNSWGGGYSQSLYDAILAAKNQGVLVVAAAGNYPCDCDSYSWCTIYPAGYNLDNIISVAATDQNDNLAWFSTYGPKSVDVGAPGKNVYSTVLPDRVTFWSDDVEGVDKWTAQSPWAKSTGASYSPTHAWRCPGQTGINSSLVLANPLDLSDKRGTQLKFYTYLDLGLGPDDWLYIEASTDGVNWYLVDWPLWFSYEFEEHLVDLSDYDGQSTVYVRFRLNFEYDIPQMGAYIDDVQFLAFPTTPTENYDYYMGTSMATPHVSGLAGLLLGYNQNLSWSDIKNLILWTGDANNALNGKVFSNRRINAKNALTLPAIVDNYSLDGVWTKSNQTITLSPIHAGGQSQISQVKYCEGASCNPSTGTILFSPYKLSYSGYQNKTVRYQAWDTATPPNSTSIGQYNVKIEQTLPTGNMYINKNATYTYSKYVTLSLSASDTYSGVKWMKFQNANSKWTSWISYKTSYSWDLTNPTYGGNSYEGTKCVYVRFKDGAGNVSSLKRDCIIYDKTPPTGSIYINKNATYTYSKYVTLNLSAADNVSGVRWMKFQNGYSKWTGWISYKTSYSWNLTNPTYGGTSTKGTKCVYVRFKDNAGNVSSMKRDCIIYR